MSQQGHSPGGNPRAASSLAVGVAAAAFGGAAVVLPSPALGVLAAICAAAFIVLIAPAFSRGRTRPAPEPTTRAEVEPPVVDESLSPEHVLRSLMRSAGAEAKPVSAHLWLVDESSGTLRPIAAVGPMGPPQAPVSLDGDDVLARVARDDASLLEEIATVRTPGDESRTITRYAFPLHAGGATGVAGVDLSRSVAESPAALDALVACVRPALHGALALHVAETETELARSLIEAARDLSRKLDPDEVLSTALERAVRLCDAATASVMLLETTTERLVIVQSHGLPQEVVKETSISSGEGIAGWVLATGQPLLIEDLPTRQQRGIRRHGVRSAVSVPIGDDDGILGVLNVGSKSFPSRFTDSHLRALETLGKQTAVALRNARAVASSRDLYFDTLRALALAMETKDPYAAGGTDRVVDLAMAIAGSFGLEEEHLEALRIAALLHDIGMSQAGESVLTEQRPLSTVERALLKMHPQIAAEILTQAPALRSVVPIVYHHHEWYDGEGYLGGIGGESIPLGARILAVADAYVAMTSERPYRSAMRPEQALAEINEKAGTQFDPSVVDVLNDVLRGERNRVPGYER